MRALALALPMLIAFGFGYSVGGWRATRAIALKWKERKELRALRVLFSRIEAQAYESMHLPGESFPAIVVADIEEAKREAGATWGIAS